MPSHRHGSSAWRRVRLIAGALLALTVLALALLHSRPVRTWALAKLVSSLEGAGITFSADRLEYNLGTLTAHVYGARFASSSMPAQPFFSAAEIHAQVTWGMLLGRVDVTNVRLVSPAVVFARDANGRSNWPALSRRSDKRVSSGPVRVRGVDVTDLRLAWDDARTDTSAETTVSLNLAYDGRALAGPIVMARPGRLRWGMRETPLQAFSGRVAWDDRDLSIDGFSIGTPEATIRVGGRVVDLTGTPRLDLLVATDADLEAISPWLRLQDPLIGMMHVEAHVSGPAARPAATLKVRSLIASSQLPPLNVEGDLAVQDGAVRVEQLRTRTAGGAIVASGRTQFDGPGSLHVTWERVSVPELLARMKLPVVAASTIGGSLDAEWQALTIDSLRLGSRVRLAAHPARAAGGPSRREPTRIPLEGTAAFRLRNGRWTLATENVLFHEAPTDASLSGVVNQQRIAGSSMAGTLRTNVSELGRLLRELVSAGVLADDLSLDGSAKGEFTVTGTLNSPSLEGPVDSMLKYANLPVVSVQTQATVNTREIDLSGIDARTTAGQLQGNVRWSYTQSRSKGPALQGANRPVAQGGELTGALQASMAVGDLLDLAGARPDLGNGTIGLDLTIAGPASRPRVAIIGGGANMAIAGQPVDRFDVAATTDGPVITVDRLRLESGSGSLSAKGIVDPSMRTYSVDGAIENLMIQQVPESVTGRPIPFSGRATGTFTGAGSFDRLQGRGQVALDEARWAEAELGRIGIDVGLADDQAAVRIDAPDLSLTANGTIGVGTSDALSAQAEWTPRDLAALAARLGVALPESSGGSADLKLRVNGSRRDLASVQGQLDAEAADLTIAGQRIQLARPGHVDYDGRVVHAEALTFNTGTSTLTLDGRLGDPTSAGLTLVLDGSLTDFAFVREIWQARFAGRTGLPPPTGTVRLRLGAQGELARPELSGSLEIAQGQVTATDRLTVAGIELGVQYRDGMVTVDKAAASAEGAALSLTAKLPSALFRDRLPQALQRFVVATNGSASLSAQIRDITPRVAAPFVEQGTLEKIGGHLDASIALEAARPELGAVRGTIVLDRADVSLSSVAFTQRVPTKLEVHDGRVDVAAWDWGKDNDRITLRGSSTIASDPAIDLDATASLDLGMVNAFLPAARVAGRADANIHFGGTATAPAMKGRVLLQEGEARFANPRLIVSDLTGAVVLTDDLLSLDGVTASANGGDVTIGGSLRHRWFRPVDGSLTLKGTGVSIDAAEFRAEVDPDVALKLEPRGPVVSGMVTVRRSSFRASRSLTGGIFDFSRLQRRSTRRDTDSALGDIRLDVRVTTDEDLLVDIQQAQLSAGADVRVVGTVSRPSLLGRMTLTEGGLIFLGVNRLRLPEQGTIDFANPSAIEPDLHLVAVTRVQGAEITLGLDGMPDAIELTLTSDDPQLSRNDLISLLVSGRTAADAAEEGVVPGGELVVGMLSGQLLGAAGQVIGLDTVRVERGTPDVRFDAGLVATETDPAARLTVGTNVGSKTEVVLSQSLEESGDLTWIVSYAAWPKLRVRVVSQDDGERLYGFQHDLSFGSPPNQARVVNGPVLAKVRDITMAGAGADEQELRARLKLKEGKQFSLFEWQDDRRRLEEFYYDRQHLEARVVTRRVAPSEDASSISLAYTVTPGPRTTLVVEGFELSKSGRHAIERAWTGAVVDDFLVEEASQIVKAELADEGYVLPSVNAMVDRSGDEKRLRLRIEPGMRAKDRRLRMEGNQQLPAARLNSVLKDQGLERAVWLEPAIVEDALTAFYRDSGYLEAKVAVEPIEMAGGVATRTVRVTEGALFRVGSLRVDGVRALPEGDVVRTAGVSVGDALTESEMERGRTAIETDYRMRGFNSVNVTTEANRIPNSDQVAVVITIDEGPQQRLEEIVTTGLLRARPSVVNRALKLDVGQPVDLAAWSAARQRLYQTGAFRSVDIEREVIEQPASSGGNTGTGIVQPIRAKVTVQEWPFLRWRYGLDLEDNPPTPTGDSSASVGVEPSSGRTFGIGVASDLRARNLFGTTLSAGVAGRYSGDFKAIRLYGTNPTFFGLPLTTNVYVERSREEIDTDTESDKASVTFEQRFRPRKRIEISYRYTLEREESIETATGLATSLPLDSTVSTTALFERRNDLISATRGWFHSSNFQYAPEALGSELPFVKYLLQQRYYRSAGPVVFATAGRLGLATAFGEELTASDRFVAGGGNSVRGYDEDQLSPIGSDGEPGGNGLFVLNQEVRFPIFKWVRGVWFFDAGRAFTTVNDISLKDLSASTGFGIRVHTPFILFRVDYGVPLDNKVTPTGSGWFFSIGQMF